MFVCTHAPLCPRCRRWIRRTGNRPHALCACPVPPGPRWGWFSGPAAGGSPCHLPPFGPDHNSAFVAYAGQGLGIGHHYVCVVYMGRMARLVAVACSWRGVWCVRGVWCLWRVPYRSSIAAVTCAVCELAFSSDGAALHTPCGSFSLPLPLLWRGVVSALASFHRGAACRLWVLVLCCRLQPRQACKRSVKLRSI